MCGGGARGYHSAHVVRGRLPESQFSFSITASNSVNVFTHAFEAGASLAHAGLNSTMRRILT